MPMLISAAPAMRNSTPLSVTVAMVAISGKNGAAKPNTTRRTLKAVIAAHFPRRRSTASPRLCADVPTFDIALLQSPRNCHRLYESPPCGRFANQPRGAGLNDGFLPSVAARAGRKQMSGWINFGGPALRDGRYLWVDSGLFSSDPSGGKRDIRGRERPCRPDLSIDHEDRLTKVSLSSCFSC